MPSTSSSYSYPCTALNCPLIFPTISDLRFHVLTSHLPPNSISSTPLHICTLPLPQTSIGHCDMYFPSASALRAHLLHAHNKHPLPPSSTTGNDKTTFLAKHTIGPATGRFWCGFCRSVVSVRRMATYGVERGDMLGRWRVARTEHVQAHFLGWNGVVAGNDLWVELRDGEPGEGKEDGAEGVEVVVNGRAVGGGGGGKGKGKTREW